MAVQVNCKYRLGEFELEPDKYLLKRHNEHIHLPELPFQVLLYLVENRDRYVSRQELLDCFWSGSHGYEETLTKCVSMIRTQLNDPPTAPRFIETRKKVGYRYIGPVELQGLTAELQKFEVERTRAVKIVVEEDDEDNQERLNQQFPTRQLSVPAYNKPKILTLGLALLTVAGLGLGTYVYFSRSKSPSAPFQSISMARLNIAGSVWRPVISADGKYIAYALDAEGKQGLWIRQMATNSTVQVVAPREGRYQGLTFSHDDNYIYYVFKEKSDPQGALYQVPVLGGVPRKLLINIQSPVTIAPDGNRLAFVRFNPIEGEDCLMVANIDGTAEQKLTSRKGDDWFEYDGLQASGPAWSPDGKAIACGAGKTSRGRLAATIVAVRVSDGAQEEFTSQRWAGFGRLVWLRDGTGLVLTGGEPMNPHQIWHVSYPSGVARKITNDFHWYNDVSLTGDRSLMVAVQLSPRTNIWTAADREAHSAIQITNSNDFGGRGGVAWTPDRKVLSLSWANTPQIWIMDQDGSNQKQLSFSEAKNQGLTATSEYVVFASDRSGKFMNIWRMGHDGTRLKQLTYGHSDGNPHCSPDGKWVVYVNADSGKPMLWKVSIDGGEPVQLTDKYSRWPQLSQDGKWIACLYWNEESGSPRRIAVIPIAGGAPVKLFDSPQTEETMNPLRWTSDGRAITYVVTRGGVSNIMSQPIEGGPARQLTNFASDEIFSYEWARDDRHLVLSRGGWTSNIVLISDSRESHR